MDWSLEVRSCFNRYMGKRNFNGAVERWKGESGRKGSKCDLDAVNETPK